MISRVFDLAIGLTLLWLTAAVVSSALLDGVRFVFKRRQKTLFAAVGTMLDGTDKPGPSSMTAELYDTPEVRFEVPWSRRGRMDEQPPLTWYRRRPPDKARRMAALGPEWIRPETFAAAACGDGFRRRLPATVRQEAHVFRSVEPIEAPAQAEEAVAAADDAVGFDEGDDVGTEEMAEWFRRGMEHVTTSYRRRSRAWLFAIGLVLSAAVQVDTVAIADHLWNDTAARTALAQSRIECPPDAAPTCTVELSPEADVPIGWEWGDEGAPFWEQFWRAGPGWFLTAFAVAVGAPFWYGVVKRLATARP